MTPSAKFSVPLEESEPDQVGTPVEIVGVRGAGNDVAVVSESRVVPLRCLKPHHFGLVFGGLSSCCCLLPGFRFLGCRGGFPGDGLHGVDPRHRRLDGDCPFTINGRNAHLIMLRVGRTLGSKTKLT